MNWPLWLELSVRSAALLLVGLVLHRVAHSSGAAFRHRFLLGVFALLAFLPVLSVLSPEIPLWLWTPDRNSKAFVTVQEISSRSLARPARGALNWPLVVWISGAATALFPLLLGTIAAARIVRRAVPLRTGLLLSDEISVPVTCGLFRPRILLPLSAQKWSKSRLEAVLLHERAHIKRHDLAVQLAAHLISALWWFQPLVWLLRKELRAESEFACDAEVIRSGFRPSEYAEELLGVAISAGRDRTFSSSAIGMVRRADLETRLRAILQLRLETAHAWRTYALICVLGAASIAASAVTLRPDQGGSIMKRTMLSALLTSAGLSAATVGGFIHDSNGAPVAGAKVSIYNPDSLVTRITPTYPVAAKKAGVQGAVELAVTISKEGVPADLQVISSPSDDLSESAVEAVRQWRYRPTLLNGNPVEIQTTIVVNYTLLK